MNMSKRDVLIAQVQNPLPQIHRKHILVTVSYSRGEDIP